MLPKTPRQHPWGWLAHHRGTDDSGKLHGKGSQVPPAQPVTDGKCLEVPKATPEGSRKEVIQRRTFWKKCVSQQVERSRINSTCLHGAIMVTRSGSCPLRNQPQEVPRDGKGWQLPSRNPTGYSFEGGQVSQTPCTKQDFSSQECQALAQMAHLFSNNF